MKPSVKFSNHWKICTTSYISYDVHNVNDFSSQPVISFSSWLCHVFFLRSTSVCWILAGHLKVKALKWPIYLSWKMVSLTCRWDKSSLFSWSPELPIPALPFSLTGWQQRGNLIFLTLRFLIIVLDITSDDMWSVQNPVKSYEGSKNSKIKVMFMLNSENFSYCICAPVTGIKLIMYSIRKT